MWVPFRLFLDVPSTRTRTLRLKGCKLDRFRIQVEEQGLPTVCILATHSPFTGSYTYLVSDPTERIGRGS